MDTPMDGPKKRRYTFTLDERIAIIREYELAEFGQRGAVLRRHGIASSTISKWRKAQREGLLEPSASARVTRTQMNRKERAEYLDLQKENAALKARLAQAESTVEVLGKASALLEALAKSAAPGQSEEGEEGTVAPARSSRRSGP